MTTTIIQADTLTQSNYNNSTLGVLQPALDIFSSARNENLSRAAKIHDNIMGRLHLSDGQTFNTKISISISGSGLAVSIVGENGLDPSAMSQANPFDIPGNEGYVRIKGATRKISAATSLTLANGTNWFGLGDSMTNNLYQELFVYAIYLSSTDTVTLGLSRYPYFNRFDDRYTGSDQPGYMHVTGTTPANSDVCEVIGRIGVKLWSNGGAYTWQTLSDYKIKVGNVTKTSLLAFKPYFTAQGGSRGSASVSDESGQYVVDYDVVQVVNMRVKISALGSYSSAAIYTLPTWGIVTAEFGTGAKLVAQASNPETGARGSMVLANNPSVEPFANKYMRMICINAQDTGNVFISAMAVNDVMTGQLFYTLR
jgi:hypothetical protein